MRWFKKHNAARQIKRRKPKRVNTTRTLMKEALRLEVETSRHLFYQAETESRMIAKAYTLELERNKTIERSYVV